MNDIYQHAENPVFNSTLPTEVDFMARKRQDQTNSYLNGCIAFVGIMGFLGSIFILNGQYSREDEHYFSGPPVCFAAKVNAGMIYDKAASGVKLAISASNRVGVPVSFEVLYDKKFPVRVCFGDGENQHITSEACYHTYRSPGIYPVKVQQSINGRWKTVSTQSIEISGIRESGLMGYSKYH